MSSTPALYSYFAFHNAKHHTAPHRTTPQQRTATAQQRNSVVDATLLYRFQQPLSTLTAHS